MVEYQFYDLKFANGAIPSIQFAEITEITNSLTEFHKLRNFGFQFQIDCDYSMKLINYGCKSQSETCEYHDLWPLLIICIFWCHK